MKLLARARTLYILVMALTLCVGCEKELPQPPLDWNTADNTNKNTEGYARRLEMPRLDASNIYNCYTTAYRGKETVTFSIEYDAEKRHSKWVAFTFDNNTSQTNWNRNNWEHTEWGGRPLPARPPTAPRCAHRRRGTQKRPLRQRTPVRIGRQAILQGCQ